MATRSVVLVTAASIAVTALVLVMQAGPWGSATHSRIVGTLDDLFLPASWDHVSEQRSGNVQCLDACPSVTRIYWIPGNLQTALEEVRVVLETNTFDVSSCVFESAGTSEVTESRPPRCSLEAHRGPVVMYVTLVEGTAETDLEPPVTIVSGQTAAVLTTQLHTYVDGQYAP